MNLLQLILPISLALLVQAAPTNVTVQGIVTDTRNGEPLPSVRISMTATISGEKRERIFTAFTGIDGRFSLSVPPADYFVVVLRPGYYGPTVLTSPQPNAKQSLNLLDGKTPSELKFSLTPAGVVTGRIFDDSGKPASGLSVSLKRMSYNEGKPRLAQWRAANTNENGEYRIYWVPPGDYLVTVERREFRNGSDLDAQAGSSTMLARTFYPGTTQLESARIVSVASGAEVNAIDFGIKTIPSFKVTGKVVNLPVAQAGPTAETPELYFTLINRDEPAAQELVFSNAVSVQDRQAGLFELRGVPAGRYELFVQARKGTPDITHWGLVSIDLNSQDLKDVAIPMRQSIELRGEVMTRGAARFSEGAFVGLLYQGSLPAGVGARVNANGQLTFKGLVEGVYRVFNVYLEPDTFIADVRQGDGSVKDSVVRIAGDSPAPIQLVISSGAATVTGIAVHPDGRKGVDTMIALLPESRTNLSLYRSISPDESGRFTMTNVTPGRYKLFGWESAPSDAWMNPQFLEQYEELGIVTTIAPGKSPDIQVPVNWPK